MRNNFNYYYFFHLLYICTCNILYNYDLFIFFKYYFHHSVPALLFERKFGRFLRRAKISWHLAQKSAQVKIGLNVIFELYTNPQHLWAFNLKPFFSHAHFLSLVIYTIETSSMYYLHILPCEWNVHFVG